MSPAEKEDFKRFVYDIVRLIPPGRATSYGAIAKAIGFSNFSRMVGKVMSQCEAEENLPAHRVVNSSGILSASNVFGEHGEMQKRLEAEGIVVINNKIRNWKTIYWDPLKEL